MDLIGTLWGLLPYVAAGAIGALVGATELIGRYRDEPFRATLTRPGFVYMAVNGLASIIVLAAAVAFNWNFGGAPNTPQAEVVRVVVAGLSAMAILRTSLFSVRVADQEVGIGPVAILQVLLVAIDAGVDRARAAHRSTATGRIMSGLQFGIVSEALPAYALALMQNLSPADQATLGKQVGELVGSKMDDRLKVLILGLMVMNAVGEDVLDSAVASIKKEIPDSAPAPTGRRGGFLSGIRGESTTDPGVAGPASGSAAEPATAAPEETPAKP